MNSAFALLLSLLSFLAVVAWAFAKDFVSAQAFVASMPVQAQAAAAASLGASVVVAIALAPLLGIFAQGRLIRLVASFGSTFAVIRIVGAAEQHPSSLTELQSPVLFDIVGFYAALLIFVASAVWMARYVRRQISQSDQQAS